MSTLKFSSSLVFVLVSMFAVGCGDDPEKAQEKCEGLVTSYCDQFVECAVASGNLTVDFTADDLRSECETFMNDSAHCEDAVRVSSDFNKCIDAVGALSCEVATNALYEADLSDRYNGTALPDSCRGAVLYSE